jgi:hypothetical protein
VPGRSASNNFINKLLAFGLFFTTKMKNNLYIISTHCSSKTTVHTPKGGHHHNHHHGTQRRVLPVMNPYLPGPGFNSLTTAIVTIIISGIPQSLQVKATTLS